MFFFCPSKEMSSYLDKVATKVARPLIHFLSICALPLTITVCLHSSAQLKAPSYIKLSQMFGGGVSMFTKSKSQPISAHSSFACCKMTEWTTQTIILNATIAEAAPKIEICSLWFLRSFLRIAQIFLILPHSNPLNFLITIEFPY